MSDQAWRDRWHKHRGTIGFIILAVGMVLALYLSAEERARAREFDGTRAEQICRESNITRAAIRAAFVKAGEATRLSFDRFTNALVAVSSSDERTPEEVKKRHEQIAFFRELLDKDLDVLKFEDVKKALAPRDCSNVAEEVREGGQG